MSLDNQIDIIQNKIFNYYNFRQVIIYILLFLINEFL